MARAQRRLAAIWFSDIMGYTALMAESEAAGLRARARHRSLLRSLAARHRGRIVDENGDELVLVFPSDLAAVQLRARRPGEPARGAGAQAPDRDPLRRRDLRRRARLRRCRERGLANQAVRDTRRGSHLGAGLRRGEGSGRARAHTARHAGAQERRMSARGLCRRRRCLGEVLPIGGRGVRRLGLEQGWPFIRAVQDV